MIPVKISVVPYVAEYIKGKYYDTAAGAVHFPSTLDIYVLIYDLLQKRPLNCPLDAGNLEFMLPERREGKDPATYNWLSERAQRRLADKMGLMMWAELHEFMDENKHENGVKFIDSVHQFMCRYGIESISEDGLLKNYQRWRDKLRRTKKRAYRRR